MTEPHRITVDLLRCGGRPSLRGMRIRVKGVLDFLAAGASHEEILADHPLLNDADIAAALSSPPVKATTRSCAWSDAVSDRRATAACAGPLAVERGTSSGTCRRYRAAGARDQ